MTDEDGLLRAILTEPGEDTPRLAYADWLCENAQLVCGGTKTYKGCFGTGRVKSKPDGAYPDGRPCPACNGTGSGRVSDGRAERAEFIRVQVELARTMDGEKPISDGLPLYKRMRELWGSYPDTNDMRAAIRRECPPLESWVVLPDSLVSGRENVDSIASVSRGFVSSLSCRAAAFMAHAEAIFRSQPVTAVRLTDREPDENVDNSGAARFRWHMDWDEDSYEVDRTYLRSDLFRELGTMTTSKTDAYNLGLAVYKTAELAQADLSAACVRFGRKLADLPPLAPAAPQPAPVGG